MWTLYNCTLQNSQVVARTTWAQSHRSSVGTHFAVVRFGLGEEEKGHKVSLLMGNECFCWLFESFSVHLQEQQVFGSSNQLLVWVSQEIKSFPQVLGNIHTSLYLCAWQWQVGPFYRVTVAIRSDPVSDSHVCKNIVAFKSVWFLWFLSHSYNQNTVFGNINTRLARRLYTADALSRKFPECTQSALSANKEWRMPSVTSQVGITVMDPSEKSGGELCQRNK